MFSYFLKFGLIGLAIVLGVSWIGWYLSPEDDLKQADIIVAISGGDTTARAQEAIRLYKEGWADHILFSGAALDPLSPSNAEVMRRMANESGVPVNAVIIEEEAANTEENAEKVKNVLDANGYKSMILVTSPYHQRRAYLEFSHVMGKDIEIINRPAIDDQWNRNLWWLSPYGWYLTVSEAVKLPFSIFK